VYLEFWLASEGRIEVSAEARFACMDPLKAYAQIQFSGPTYKPTLYIFTYRREDSVCRQEVLFCLHKQSLDNQKDRVYDPQRR